MIRIRQSFWFIDIISCTLLVVGQVLITFSPRGVPDGHRHMHGYGSHTYKWVNSEGKAHWVKFHFLTDQGIKNLTHEQSVEIAGINPDYSTEDLFQNIQNGNYPSWTFKVQVMPLEDAPKYRFDPFDLTKVIEILEPFSIQFPFEFGFGVCFCRNDVSEKLGHEYKQQLRKMANYWVFCLLMLCRYGHTRTIH